VNSVIYKYEINPNAGMREQAIPRGAVFLDFQNQGGELVMWFEVDPDERADRRAFQLIGTGNFFDKKHLKYLATAQDGPFVWHLYEVPEEDL